MLNRKIKINNVTAPIVEHPVVKQVHYGIKSSLWGRKSKILILGFILFVLIGIFSPITKVRAEDCTGKDKKGEWVPQGCTVPGSATAPETSGATTTGTDKKSDPEKSAFERNVGEDYECGVMNGSIWPGCFVQTFYGLFYVIPAFLMTWAAKFFDLLISISLNSTLLKSQFISDAWAVIRDLSNIFFILILLYIAIKIILGMGGSEVKKMLGSVVIMALLINFSMFFTQVIIDSSNILALIFYNKLSLVDKKGNPIMDNPTNGEKGISAGIVSAFNPTAALGEDFFKEARKPIPPETEPLKKIPIGIVIGMILITGAVFILATYVFLVAGLSFMGRVIELFVLIIFSPFAFMSYSIPLLSGIKYLGWKAWFDRLLKVSFMAPVFMFLLYFVFMLINANIFSDSLAKGEGILIMLLRMAIPAFVVLTILLKATDFAKEGAGKIGELVMSGAKMVGGLALGAATGGASMLASNSAGRIARNIANDDDLKAKAAAGDKGAQRKLALANSVAKSSFDLRQTGMGKFASQKSGMDFNKGTGMIGLSTDKLKGGRKERDEEKFKKAEDKKKSYEMGPAAALKQNDLATKAENQNKKADHYENQYEKDKQEAKKWSKDNKTSFDEKAFKEDYEKGGDMNAHGLDKVTEKRTEDDYHTDKIQTAAQVNGERGKAYAYSLAHPMEKGIKDKGVIRNFLSEWRRGMTDVVTSKGGLATTGVAIAATGGFGALAIPIGGLAMAIKAMIPANKELVARIAKGKTEDQKLLELLKNRPGVAPEAPKAEEAKK